MVRLRSFLRPPEGVRPLATGLVLAAAGTAWAAPSAVETLDAAALRELSEAGGTTGIRPVSAEEPAGFDVPAPLPATTASPMRPAAGRPKPKESRFDVLKPFKGLTDRDDRTQTPRKAASATRPPGGTVPTYPRTGGTIYGGTGIQQMSSPGGTMSDAESSPSPTAKKSRNPIMGFFSGKPSSAAKRQSAGRTSKPSSTSTVSGGGMFGRMLRPFRGEEKTAAAPLSTQPPVPPPLNIPSSAGARKLPPAAPAPQTFAAEERFVPPAAPATAATPPVALPDTSENPFADVQSAEPPAAQAIVINPLPKHPLEDEFADVRGSVAPDATAVADLDPEFTTPVRIVDPGAPRPLDPEAVSSTEDAGQGPAAAPPAELAPPVPHQSAAARLAELQRKLAERSGLGGFQGFCPVALRDRRELLDSRPEFLSVFQNRTYELSSAEAKARFEADPARYAPASGGNDPVLVSRGEPEAEGSLTHAVWFKDRLYLFRTAETLREFNAEPTKFAAE